MPSQAEPAASPDGQILLTEVPYEVEPIDESALLEHGEVFTRRWVVELILDLCGYTSDRDLIGLTALEPSCGGGAFLGPMTERLIESATRHDRNLSEARNSIRAFDLLSRNVDRSRALVTRLLSDAGMSKKAAVARAEEWITQTDFILEAPPSESAEFVLGNPPYVRLEELATDRSAAYRELCQTMGGRSDIYIGFFEMGLRALRRGGSLGFICADRWMRNAYGSRLRNMISHGWSMETVINMTGVDAFDEEVDAYPAITVLKRKPQEEGPAIVDARPEFGEVDATSLIEWVKDRPNSVTTESSRFTATRMPSWFNGSGGWPSGSPERIALIGQLETEFHPLEDPGTGTKVGIGVATGADKIFIVKEAPGVEPERMLPLAMAGDISGGEVEWSGRFLVDPWDQDGLVDLADWPGLAAYLTPFKDKLSARHTARTGKWHKTIDRVIDGLTERRKLYLPDFKEAIFPVLDEGKTYPHHNLYWVTSESWDLEVLGGLLLSDIANLFIESYSVRMRGGYLRFQAQYLRRIRVPDLTKVDPDSARSLAAAFRSRDRDAATAAALPLYGIDSLPD